MLGALPDRKLAAIYLSQLQKTLRTYLLANTEIPDWLLEHDRRMPSDSDVHLIRSLLRKSSRSRTKGSKSRSRFI